MPIINSSKGTVLAKRFILCTSFFSKLKGLMFTKSSSLKKHSLIFQFKFSTPQSIHMFFVFYPIDVVFLDKNRKVVDIKKGLKPFGIYDSWKSSVYVLELPEHTIKSSRTELGDFLKWG
jgi:uncharacterized membrane protein (UPF0127 family)